MKTSKVISVTPQGDYQLKDGKTLYKFSLQFENGDSGEYSSVKPDQNKFVAGQEAEYELNATQYGNRIKPVYSQGGGYSSNYSQNSYSGGSDNKQKLIVKQSCLKAAVDFLKDKQAKSTDVLKVADSFVEWVMEADSSEDKSESTYDNHFSSREEKIEAARSIVNGDDNLPF